MNTRFLIRNALGLIFGLMFLPWAGAQQPAAPNDLPSAESILDRYVEVTGGLAAHESRTSAVTTGTFEVAAANLTGQLRIIVKPGLQRTTIQLPGVGTIDGGVNNGVAWSSDPFACVERRAVQRSVQARVPGPHRSHGVTALTSGRRGGRCGRGRTARTLLTPSVCS